MAAINTDTFTISVIGETSQEKWYGSFTVKTRLSHKDRLEQDRIRRQYLGGDPVGASQRALTSAEIFSQCAVRITKCPPWWTDADNGTDLADDNVVAEVYNKALECESKLAEELKKKAEEVAKTIQDPSNG